MSPGRRGRAGRGFGWPAWTAGALAIAALAGWLAWISPAFNETSRDRGVFSAVGRWAAGVGCVENEVVRRTELRSSFPRRWLREERFYWYPVRLGRTRLLKELEKEALARGLELRPPPAKGRSFTAVLLLPGGREGMELKFAPKNFVAIIIDDLGYSTKTSRRVAALPARITGAVLPFTPRDRATAEILFSAGKEVFLHMPMQTGYRAAKVPEYAVAIRKGQSPEEISSRLERSLNRLPHITGMNNHEGSVATEHMELMAPLMPVLKRRGLVFVDSWTTPKSQGIRAASNAGLPWAKREVFLDASMDRKEIRKAFWRLVGIARRWGGAVGIGHPHEVTLEVLEREMPKAIQSGIVFVGASTVARIRKLAPLPETNGGTNAK